MRIKAQWRNDCGFKAYDNTAIKTNYLNNAYWLKDAGWWGGFNQTENNNQSRFKEKDSQIELKKNNVSKLSDKSFINDNFRKKNTNKIIEKINILKNKDSIKINESKFNNNENLNIKKELNIRNLNPGNKMKFKSKTHDKSSSSSNNTISESTDPLCKLIADDNYPACSDFKLYGTQHELISKP